MTNYSRTTLRELKKRYLNILKKCLLANLMAFSFVLPSVAETVTNPATNEELLEALLDPTKSVKITDTTTEYNIIVDSKNNVFSNKDYFTVRLLTNSGFLNFYGDAVFDNNHSLLNTENNQLGEFQHGGAFHNQGKITFKGKTIFQNNYSEASRMTWGAVFLNGSNGELVFEKDFYAVNNISTLNGQIFGGVLVNDGQIKFLGKNYFIGNGMISLNSHIKAGAIYTTGNLEFYGETLFKDNVIQTNSSKDSANAGAFYSQGGNSKLLFREKVVFDSNGIINLGPAENQGGALTFYGGKGITFEKEAIFQNNFIKSQNGNGGAIMSTTNINFCDNAYFFQNKIFGSGRGGGGLFTEGGTISFYANAYFINNVILNNSNSEEKNVGGALVISGLGVVNLNSNFIFAGNNAKKGKDIFWEQEKKSFLNINGSKNTVGTIEGGIAGVTTGGINKSGTGLLVLGDNSENHEYEGAFTQTAGVTIANSERFFSHEKAVNTINGGELKTHGAEITYKATLGETGTLTHLGSSVDTPTEIKGVTFNGTGLNLTLGTYTKAEQEKEIALVGDRIVEYVDDKGTEDTSDDELVSYQATDKLFTVKALENDQKAKFILKENLAGMDGNTLTIDNAELDVKEGLKVAGKVIAKDMTVSKGRAPVSFTNLEVAKEGVLDIGTREMNVDSMTLQEGATLKIALNSLQEHGKVNGLITGTSTSQLALNLATDVDMGTYQLFDQDNDIALEENLFFNIKDLENGAYQVEKKTTSELVSTFGGETEAKVATALMEGESSNEAFSKMQSEILEALQSKDKAQVQKAKKTLSAVGTSEQPSSQSIAASHFNELTRVISQMAMEKEAEIVGHSGGDTDPRAKVYIKGLYDRTKSSMGEGFRARSKGAVLGVQSEVTEDLTLGVGYATSQTTAKEDLRRTEVDTNTGFISAHYQPNAWWVSGLATFSRGEYEEEKQILSSMGKASYDVDSWGAQVMTGYDIKLETAVITPEVGMRYLAVKQEGYADTLGTTVSGTRSDYLTALVGVKGTWNMGAIRPTAGVTVGYDIISDDVSALNTLANGASYTVNGEALDRLSTGVSLGIEADLGERTTLKLDYSGTYRKEYVDHSGMIKFELRF